MQVCVGTPRGGSWAFDAFHQVEVETAPDNADIYFAHPYHVGKGLLLVYAMALPDGTGGIYVSLQKGEDLPVSFGPPVRLLESQSPKCRTWPRGPQRQQSRVCGTPPYSRSPRAMVDRSSTSYLN